MCFGIAALLMVAGFLLDTRAWLSQEKLQVSLGQASRSSRLAYLDPTNLIF